MSSLALVFDKANTMRLAEDLMSLVELFGQQCQCSLFIFVVMEDLLTQAA